MSTFLARIKTFCLEHWPMLIAAVVLSVLIASPLIAFRLKTGDVYQGINIHDLGANGHEYLSRGKEVLEGKPLGNPMLRENKDSPDYYFNINEKVLIAPVRFLGLQNSIDIVTLYNFYNVLGIFILLLLIYFFTLELYPDKWLAVAISLFVVGGYSIIYQKGLFYNDFNIYGRAMYPYTASVAFFSYLLLLLRTLKRPSRKSIVYTGIAFGLLFYLYFFAWTFTLVLNSLLLFFFLVKKDWPSFKILAWISGIGILLGLWNIVRIMQFLNSPAGEQFLFFSWSSNGRELVSSNLGLLTLLSLGALYFKNRQDKSFTLLLVFSLAGWISLNQQFITDRFIQYNHYYWFFITPTAIVTLIYVAWMFLPKKHWRVIFSILIVGVVYLNTAVGQYRSALVTWDFKLYEQRYRPIVDALNETKSSTVVLAADDVVSDLVTIYTPHDLFWNGFAKLNDIPMNRFKDALLVFLYINQESRQDPAAYLHKIVVDEKDNSFYKNLYMSIEGFHSGFDYYEYRRLATDDVDSLKKLRGETIDEISSLYKDLKESGIQEILSRYGVRYLIWDSTRYPEWDITILQNLEETAKEGGVYLYHFKGN